MEFKVVTFMIGAEKYAIEISNVESVVEMLPITKIPDMPHGVEGVINLRGEVIPVIDGRKRLSSALEADETRKAQIVIIMLNNKKYGLIVDQVNEVLDVNEQEAVGSKEVINADTQCAEKIIKKGEQLVVLLKPSAILGQFT